MEANFLLTARHGDLGYDVDVFEEFNDVVRYLEASFYEHMNLKRDIPAGSSESSTRWDADKAVYDKWCNFLKDNLTVKEAKRFSFYIDDTTIEKCSGHSEDSELVTFMIETTSPQWCHPARKNKTA